MSIIWKASVESYQHVIAEKKHIVEGLEAELALWNLDKQESPVASGATWYIKNQLLNINRQIKDLEEWLRKLEEKGE